MGNRLTRLYTRTGDDGSTGLGDGTRVAKSSLRIEVIGDVDELNSILGLLISMDTGLDIRELLLDVQHVLFDAGGELSLPGQTFLDERYVKAVEAAIDRYNGLLPPLKEFILPGGSQAAAVAQLARAVCRRAERHMVELNASEPVNRQMLIYFNRLSDLLFVLARTLARDYGSGEIFWNKNRLDR